MFSCVALGRVFSFMQERRRWVQLIFLFINMIPYKSGNRIKIKSQKRQKCFSYATQDPREFCLVIHVVLLYVGLNTEGRQVAKWDCRSQQGKAILKVVMFIAVKTRINNFNNKIKLIQFLNIEILLILTFLENRELNFFPVFEGYIFVL